MSGVQRANADHASRRALQPVATPVHLRVKAPTVTTFLARGRSSWNRTQERTRVDGGLRILLHDHGEGDGHRRTPRPPYLAGPEQVGEPLDEILERPRRSQPVREANFSLEWLANVWTTLQEPRSIRRAQRVPAVPRRWREFGRPLRTTPAPPME